MCFVVCARGEGGGGGGSDVECKVLCDEKPIFSRYFG